MDDFARGIEDAVADLMKGAIKIVQEKVQNSIFAGRPHALPPIIMRELVKLSFPVHQSTIRHAAEIAVHMYA